MKKRMLALLLGLTMAGSTGISCFAGNFRMRHQEQSNWCWVAVGQALLTEYDIDVTQNEFFEAAFFGAFSDLEALGRKRPAPGREGEYRGGSEEICEAMNLFLMQHDKKVKAHQMTILLNDGEAQANVQAIAQARSEAEAKLRDISRAKMNAEAKAKASTESLMIAQTKLFGEEQKLAGMLSQADVLCGIQAQMGGGNSSFYHTTFEDVQREIDRLLASAEKSRAEIEELSIHQAEAKVEIEELSGTEAEIKAEMEELSRVEAESRNVAQRSCMLQDDQDALSRLSDIINLLQHGTPVAFQRGGHWVVLSGIRFPAPEDADQTVYVSVRNTNFAGEQGEDSLHPLVEYLNSERSGQLDFVYIA